MNFKRSFHLVVNSIGLLIIGCSGNQNISNSVDAFFKNYLSNHDFRKTDPGTLSSGLALLIDKVKIKENKESEKFKKVNSTDKPPFIEGDIFTSNYEGATSYEILEIKETGNEAIIKMSFKYAQAEPTLQWNDEIHILKENNTWKIDNVVYGNKSPEAKDIKQVLTNFLTEEPTMAGNDADEHGCLASAGYRWSSLKKECIRSFELPLRLVNSDKTFLAGVLFSEDKKQAEVFTKDGAFILEQKTNKRYATHENNKGNFVLEEKNGKWAFSKASGEIEYSEE